MLVKETLNESKRSSPIIFNKLQEYAKGIDIVCGGEYGDVYYNEYDNHVFICLGDSHPFDEEYLESFIKEYIKKDYDSLKEIKVTIENESNPSGSGWIKIKV